MENYSRGPIHQVIYWNGLNESPIFNSDAKEARKNKERIKQLDSVYGRHSKRLFHPGPVKAQTANFRLTPLFSIEEIYTETHRDQNPATCAADACTWTSTKSKSHLIPNYLTQASLRQGRFRQFATKPSVQDIPASPRPQSLSSRPSDTSFWTASDSSTPLPVFPQRAPTDQFLYRRPTIVKAMPLTSIEELFSVLANTIDLKPIPFKKTADSYKFYEFNFPLLLTTIPVDKERCSTPSKRSRTPESPMSMMIARKKLLNQRLVDLECMMVDMERGTEDVRFITELHDPVFDPTTWSWNKFDVQGLRRRYTIDASLREM